MAKANTRNRLVRNCNWAMCKAQDNVSVPDGVSFISDEQMRDLLFNAARDWPMWQFKVERDNRFEMLFGDEYLGEVKMEWVRRSGNNLMCLYGPRVSAAMNRRDCYSSPDAAAVIRKIKEYVYPKTDIELAKPIVSAAQSCAGTEVYQMRNEKNKLSKGIADAATEFALSVNGREAFLAYEAKYHADRNTVAALDKITEVALTESYADTIQQVLYDVDTPNDRFLVAERGKGGGWTVWFNGKLTKYADDELPAQYSNIQMLKMVNVDVVLPNIGMRAKENLYIAEILVSKETV